MALGGALCLQNEGTDVFTATVLYLNVTAAVIIGNGRDYKNDTANAILGRFAKLMFFN